MPRFDVDTLRETAGEAAFARGKEYFRDQRVDITSIDAARVAASVSGSELYAAELKGADKRFSGKCTCPAFADWGFCKHLVATALAANALTPGEITASEERRGQIRRHLVASGAEALADMILKLAERDPRLQAELELSTAAELEDDKALFARMRKAVTQATRTAGFVDYAEVGGWAQGVEDVLGGIERLVAADRAPVARDLLDYLFARLDDALESMDDSDGTVAGLFASAVEIHIAACRKAKPDLIDLARELFDREVDSDWDFFDGASVAYADVLGEAGLAEYRSLAGEAWQKIKPLGPGDRRADDEQASARYRLGGILEAFADQDGDVDARIAIRSKDLSSAYAYLGIGQLCLDNGRDAEALKWAEDGLFLFEDAPDERLVIFAADLYERARRVPEAEALLWRSFERHPGMPLYQRIRAIAGNDPDAVRSARERALAFLRARVLAPRKVSAGWSPPVGLLLTFLLEERLLTEAWQAVRAHACSEAYLERLAAASQESHPAEALDAYAKLVERLVSLGGNGNYEGACRFIRRMATIRQRMGADADQAIYVDDLAKRHKAKRNFVKLLVGQRERGGDRGRVTPLTTRPAE